MKHPNFIVSSFENRNGNTSWRVDCYLNGVRIRRNFKTREEAAAEKSTLEILAAQTVSGMRTVAKSLSDEQVREAEEIFQRLRSQPCALSFYVDFSLTNYKKPDQQKKLAAACADYIAACSRPSSNSAFNAGGRRKIRFEGASLPVPSET